MSEYIVPRIVAELLALIHSAARVEVALKKCAGSRQLADDVGDKIFNRTYHIWMLARGLLIITLILHGPHAFIYMENPWSL